MLRTYLRWISIESLLNSILHLILSLCKKNIYINIEIIEKFLFFILLQFPKSNSDSNLILFEP